MREILFKAKRLDNGEWVQGWPYMDPMHDHAHITYHLCGHPVHIAVDPETICQYTGMTDKNGVKIFEGDIAKIPCWISDDKCKAVCKFIDGSNSVEPVIGFAFSFFNEMEDSIIRSDEWDEFEVIGNIHDKKECKE